MFKASSAKSLLASKESTAVNPALHLAHLPVRRPLRAVQYPSSHRQSCWSHTREATGRCRAWGRSKRQPEGPNSANNGSGPLRGDPSSEAAGKQQGRQASIQQTSQQPSQPNSQKTSQQGASQSVVSSNGSASAGTERPKRRQHTDWEDWEEWESDWEAQDDNQAPPDQFRRRNPRRGMGTATPRDEYLRPMIDTIGIQYRLGFKQLEAEERVQTEFETNQWESREAVKFGGEAQYCALHPDLMFSVLRSS